MSESQPSPEQPQFAQLFPTTILTCRLPNAGVLNRELLAHIQDLKIRDSAGRRRSNQLGWQSNNLDYGVPVVQGFCGLILERCQAYGCGLGWALRDELKLVMKECWANVNERYAYNQPHTHANALLSGVYYVQVPVGSCGHLVLLDPRSQPWVLQPEYAERNIANMPMHRLPPEEGRLVLFPSWLEHSVEQNLSDGERISISFNVDLVPAAMMAAVRER